MLADAIRDRSYDTDVHVGLEERGADFPHHLVDVGFGEATLASEASGDPLEATGQGVEHRSEATGAPSTRPGGSSGQNSDHGVGFDVDVHAVVAVVHRHRETLTVDGGDAHLNVEVGGEGRELVERHRRRGLEAGE